MNADSLSHCVSVNIVRGMRVKSGYFLAKTIIPNHHAVQIPLTKRQQPLDDVVMRFSAKEQGNGFALRQEKTRYFLHSEWLYHASA